VFQRNGSLWVAPFDQARLELTGPPAVVLESVAIALDWSPMIAVTRNGALAYATGGEPYPPRTLLWVDQAGHEEALDAPARAWFWPQISPDGKRLGMHIMDPVNMDAWIYELDRGPLVRMTYDARQDGYPLWSPDGTRVAFWSRQGGSDSNLYVRSAELTGRDQRLTATDNGTYQLPMAWTQDGHLLVFEQWVSAATKIDIGVIPVDGVGTPTLLLQGPSDEAHPAISPDGRWIAYQSNQSGRWEVYVQPFPGLGGRWQLSTQGGVSPTWDPNGGRLFYRNDRAMMSVPVTTTGNTFRYGNPRMLFEGSYVPEESAPYDARSYAVAPDGRFLMMKEPEQRPTQIVVILNWAEELKRSAGMTH
jgi:dipeptidyl aminopeptidase/acylaminoacyl peptidase